MIFNEKIDKTIEDNCDLYLSDRSSDVILVMGRDALPAHKSVLRKQSEYFNAMFSIEMIEHSLREVSLEEVLTKQFVFVLRLAYGYRPSDRELRIMSFNDIFDAIIIANKYQFRSVEELLSVQFFDKLNNNFSSDYLCVNEKKPIGQLDRLFTLSEVQEISKSYNLDYFSDLCKSYIESKSHRGVDAYKYCYNLWC